MDPLKQLTVDNVAIVQATFVLYNPLFIVQVIIDVESVVREYMRPAAATSSSPPGDLPPKYEDLADCPPPQYDESTMRSDDALDTPEQDAAADEADENMRRDNKGQN